MDDCIHEINLCPDCDGLVATRFQHLGGVATVDLGFGTGLTDVTVYIGPAPGPCHPDQ